MTRPHRASAPVSATKKKPSALDFADMPDEAIHNLISALYSELHDRAMRSDDPDVLGDAFLENLSSNEVGAPEVLGDKYVALGGAIKYNGSGTRHTCTLYSVYISGAEPFWAWEDTGTLAYSKSVRIGELRQSAALHIAVDGMKLVRHKMKHDGERHTRISEETYECVWDKDTGKLRIRRTADTAKSLPVPANH